jgi:hypothetical protein
LTPRPDPLADFSEALRARACVDLAGLGDELRAHDPVVVILGASIPGIVLAARLAAAVRVVLVTGPPPVPVRLVNGCSLRRSTLFVLERALGCAAGALAERLGGAAASFAELRITRAEAGAPVRFVGRDVVWRSERPIGLSTRHGAILAALRAALPCHPRLTLIPGEVPRDAVLDGGALPLTTGRLALPRGRHVVLNATPHATILRPHRSLPPPEGVVAAVQAPMRAARTHGDVAFAPVLSPLGHLAFYTPFADGHTPEATWYGINTLVAPAADRATLDAVRAQLFAMGDALGLAPVGGDAARGEAVVPVVRDPGALTQMRLDDGQPIVDVSRAFTSGAPAINVDGMLAGARGAEAFAAAFLASPEPPLAAATRALDASDAALAPLRARNRASEWFFFSAPERFRRAALAMTGPRVARVFTEDFADLCL